MLTSASVSVSCLVSSLHAVISDQKLCRVWPVQIRTSSTTQLGDGVTILRKEWAESVCQKSVVVSPVEILIFVCEAFYPGKDRTQGLSHWWHELVSICSQASGPGKRGSSHYFDSKDWASASCRVGLLLLQGMVLSQKQWILTVLSLTSCLSPISFRWVCFELFKLWALNWRD